MQKQQAKTTDKNSMQKQHANIRYVFVHTKTQWINHCAFDYKYIMIILSQ